MNQPAQRARKRGSTDFVRGGGDASPDNCSIMSVFARISGHPANPNGKSGLETERSGASLTIEGANNRIIFSLKDQCTRLLNQDSPALLQKPCTGAIGPNRTPTLEIDRTDLPDGLLGLWLFCCAHNPYKGRTHRPWRVKNKAIKEKERYDNDGDPHKEKTTGRFLPGTFLFGRCGLPFLCCFLFQGRSTTKPTLTGSHRDVNGNQSERSRVRCSGKTVLLP
ncbi:MAG: hypothetical protein A4E62_00320 [Syntrophorhabdus sp. PtaU1.Bin002]|nr:MAG: hypothetical protein A4E58_02534 [Syntrophorhabdus sp. PtaB.Bin006]OPY73728.1 MAG: hypothetical protein A4E62_00320 [Syntrophorhabdus sp. PtaU1.Bin002]